MEVALTSALVSASHSPLQLLTTLNIFGAIWPPQAIVKNNDVFNYIIVGSGVGAVVANRLTENLDCDVLVIEAGDNPSIEAMFPGLYAALQNSYQDWNFRSQPEKASQSQSGNVFKLSAGKSLGGSSAINHLIHLRGDPYTFDSWAENINDSSWRYEHILPYFIKSETLDDKEIMKSHYAEYHGTEGPMKLTRDPKTSAVEYLQAFEDSGNPTRLDLNGNDTLGYAQAMFIIGDDVRQSTAQAYLRSKKNKRNLHVLKNTLATKILFDEEKNAIGVEVLLENGNQITLKANTGVIVSAGVFNTPKLLMLSGIGPKEDLEKMNIPVISDLPVGKNMQDHPAVALAYKMEPSSEISQIPSLTGLPFPVILGAVTLDKSKSYPEYQTINLIFAHDTPYLLTGCAILVGYKNEICHKFVDSTRGHTHMLTLLYISQPKSTGVVKLKSSNPNDAPVIRANYYRNKTDLSNMVRFIQDFMKVGNSSYFQSVNAKLVDLELDECKNEYGSTEYWYCYVKRVTSSLHHATSTCAMGKVVDSELNVYGVQKLRVVDASVMPNVVRANPLAATIMIAEKISDVIKNNNKCACSNK